MPKRHRELREKTRWLGCQRNSSPSPPISCEHAQAATFKLPASRHSPILLPFEGCQPGGPSPPTLACGPARAKTRKISPFATHCLHADHAALLKSGMVDLYPNARSRQMALVRSKDTKPELAVRKLVFSMGHRYRIHGSGLPSKPDLVFSRKKKAIFVHGCFWHRHAGCRKATTPASNTEYWLPKFSRTVERDRESLAALHVMGWTTLVVWECELKDMDALASKLREFLNDQREPLGLPE